MLFRRVFSHIREISIFDFLCGKRTRNWKIHESRYNAKNFPIVFNDKSPLINELLSGRSNLSFSFSPSVWRLKRNFKLPSPSDPPIRAILRFIPRVWLSFQPSFSISHSVGGWEGGTNLPRDSFGWFYPLFDLTEVGRDNKRPTFLVYRGIC